MPAASPLSPTFYGHIASTHDALLLFEACLNGTLNHVARRPHDRERASLIKSGNVFIYEEHSSGIKRWTDGVPWSPSRILGNFLVYRELERPFPPGEKKRAMKRNRRSSGLSSASELFGGSINTDTDANVNGYTTDYTSPSLSTVTSTSASIMGSSPSTALDRDTERALIGSLVDSYGFKDDGLVKKTVSVVVGGVSHHLVSYYTVADVMNNRFTTPAKDPRFQHITPRHELVTKQNFRAPIDEVDSMDRMEARTLSNTYPQLRNGYEMTNQSISNRDMPLSVPPISYMASSMCSNYGLGNNSFAFDGLPTVQAGNTFNGQFVPVPGIYPAPKSDSFDLGNYKQQRNSTMMDIGSDSGRSLPSFNTNYMRRPSIFDETNSVESGISGVTSSSVSSRFSGDSSYSSQGLYGSFKDSSHSSHNDPLQKSLPTPIPHGFYDRPTHGYAALGDSAGLKESLWQIGNAGVGHGHCLGSQQQWASTGTS